MGFPAPYWRGNRRPCRRCREVWMDCSDSFRDIRLAMRRAAETLDRQEALSWLPGPAAEHLSALMELCPEDRRRHGKSFQPPQSVENWQAERLRQHAFRQLKPLLRAAGVSPARQAWPGLAAQSQQVSLVVQPLADYGPTIFQRTANSLSRDESKRLPPRARRLQDRDGLPLSPGLSSTRPSSSPRQASVSRRELLPQPCPARQVPLPVPVLAV